MAHYLSQEQVLGIRARLFTANGRVTVGGVRDAVRVVGQDELSDEEVLRLVGFDSNNTPLGSFVGNKKAGEKKQQQRRELKKEERRRAKREAKRKQPKTRHDYFIASSSDSDDDNDESRKNSNDDNNNDEGFRLPMKLEDDFVFPSTVDFPMFLQRLNRLVQDRETVRELKQLFYVLARFAFERRQKDLLQQQQSFAKASGTTASGIMSALSGTGGGGAALSSSAAAMGGASPDMTLSSMKAGSNVLAAPAAAKQHAKGFDASGFLAVQGAGDYDGLDAQSSRREMERFLQIRSSVDKTSAVSQQQLEMQQQLLQQEEDEANGDENDDDKRTKFPAPVPGGGGEGKNSPNQQSKAAAMFFSVEEVNLLNNPTVLMREELRQVVAEVLEAAARKSTGIDHVMAGLEEGENFITCERFVQLILRGGPEVVSLPFLL